ncbi:thiamine diphosphate-binding protein [Pholiota conissans]|uniref:Thiamine diphosphate-binding protein n=1 Tax=Pholiota conissans TaxID=109636 RepID=A0A9P5YUR0_9AGAR|nr:thiamine diphosphate-binding protein [Pholiota conissans]
MTTSTYTTSTLFLRSLSCAGITHAFVNWGSDHPALLEELERQRVESGTGKAQLNIITCPNEMVALSAAQGFTQSTGKIAAVIVHVDVGTQALAGAVHNVDRSRTPVLIYAGASPFSAQGEHKGTRNEWIMWIQDIPDQSAILRQYMRHTAQINSAKTVEKSIKRALQIATSSPSGPVYLWARREVMEEEIEPQSINLVSDMTGWPSIELSALSSNVTKIIASSLLHASSPMIITSHLGRSKSAVSALISLATLLALPVINSCPSAVNIPFTHPSYTGVTFLAPGTHWEGLNKADVILVLDSDTPWITENDRPQDGAKVFIIDGGDPLKVNIGYSHTDAEIICRADPGVALSQIEEGLREMGVRPEGEHWELIGADLNDNTESRIDARRLALAQAHSALVTNLDNAEAIFPSISSSGTEEGQGKYFSVTVPNLVGVLRQTIISATPSRGANTLILNESISNYPAVWHHLRPEFPGTVISSGGSSLGWGLGAAVGSSLSGRETDKPHELIVVIVGDGSFMFGVPSSAYWMARRYETPFLTIVLNNGGWKSPKLSMLGVHPKGHGSSVPGAQLSVGFGPSCPDYAQIAVAASAGWAWGTRIGGSVDAELAGLDEHALQKKLNDVIKDAIRIVMEEKRCAVVDCVLESI